MKNLFQMMRWIAATLFLLAGVALGAQAEAGGAKDALLAAKPLFDKPQKAAIIKLDRVVDDMMERSIKRRLDIARKAGCTLIIFEIDTYGGLVTSGINISTLIKRLPAENLHTVAWIHDKAISAGAMISVACEKIVMSSHSRVGDCGVIAMDSDNKLVPLPETERAKAESPVVKEFEDSAKTNGYNEQVLRAMVITAEEVYAVHNFQTGEWRYVNKKEKDNLVNTAVPVPGGGQEHPWKFDRLEDDEKSLLTVFPDKAVPMKLASAVAEDERQLSAVLNLEGAPLVLGFNWAEVTTTFLSTTYVRFMLFIGMLVCAWLEFAHPGVSVFGIAALICLVLLVGAPFLTGLAQVWEIALIVIGLAIIIADLAIFGGVGFLAVPGFILLAIGLVASFVPANPGGGFLPPNAASWNNVVQGMGVLVGGSFTAIAAFYFLAKYLHKTPGLKRLQLLPAGGLSAAQTVSAIEVRDIADRPADDAVFVGALGRALSDLRPAGKAAFGDHVVAVESFGNFIEKGAEVTVIEVGSMRVVVKAHARASN